MSGSCKKPVELITKDTVNIVEVGNMEKMVQKDQILQMAIRRNLRQNIIEENGASAFSVIHQCMEAVNTTELTEDRKREKLIYNLQNYLHGKSEFVEGCRRSHIQEIIKLVFGMKEKKDSCLHKELSPYSFQELYLYYCYVEQIAKSSSFFIDLLKKRYMAQQGRKAIQGITVAQKEQEEKKEAQKKKFEEMSQEQKWGYEICEMQKDMQYFRELLNSVKYSNEDRKIIANILKAYWKDIGKWEGNGVSKKQVEKICKIKEILGE